MGVADRDVLRGVKQDVEASKFHIACNRVFEHAHARELRREKEAEGSSARLSETIIHPNEYFSRSFGLKNPGALEGVSAHQGNEMVDPML